MKKKPTGEFITSFAEEAGICGVLRTSAPDIVYTERKISELKKAEYNPRKIGSAQRASLKECMMKFGFVGHVVVNSNPDRRDVIVGGHQRVDLWRELGHDTVPCAEMNLTEAEERELNIRLNKNGGEFDLKLLGEFFENNELIGFGFSMDELVDLDAGRGTGGVELPESGDFEIPEMEQRLYEHQDYIVFVFDEMHDFIKIVNAFDIRKVNSSYSEKRQRIGIGRVISGKKLLEKMFGKQE